METLGDSIWVIDHELPEASGLRVVRNGEVGLQPHRTLDSKAGSGPGRGPHRRQGEASHFLGARPQGTPGCRRRRESSRRGTAWRLSMRVSERAMECDAKRLTSSVGEKPASSKREKILPTESSGLGTRPSAAGCVAFGRPAKNLEARSTRAVGNRHSTRKLDQVTSGDGELLKEGPQVVNGIVNTVVSG